MYHGMLMVWHQQSTDPIGLEDESPIYEIVDYCITEDQAKEAIELYGILDVRVEPVAIELVSNVADLHTAGLCTIRVYPASTSIVEPHAAIVEISRVQPFIDKEEKENAVGC